MYDKFNKNVTLLAKNQEYVSQKFEKSYFSTKYRISAQNRIRPRCQYDLRFITKTDFRVILLFLLGVVPSSKAQEKNIKGKEKDRVQPVETTCEIKTSIIT